MSAKSILHSRLVAIKSEHDAYMSGKKSVQFENDYTFGICMYLHIEQPSEVKELFDNLAETWPGFSGNRVYPVPCPKHPDPSKAYTVGCENGLTQTEYRWNTDKSEYAVNRVALVDYLIDLLELN